MAFEKTYTQLIDEAHYQSHLGKSKIPPARKYKKESHYDPEEGEDIGLGTRVIVADYSKGSLIGYMLCAVVGVDDNGAWWSYRTKFIVEVLEVSNPVLEEHIGQLRVASGRETGFMANRPIVEVGKANWENYQVTNADE